MIDQFSFNMVIRSCCYKFFILYYFSCKIENLTTIYLHEARLLLLLLGSARYFLLGFNFLRGV